MKEVVYEVVCPHCHKRNKVFVLLSDDFNEKEEFHCDFCGLEIGAVAAAEPPRTEYVKDENQ